MKGLCHAEYADGTQDFDRGNPVPTKTRESCLHQELNCTLWVWEHLLLHLVPSTAAEDGRSAPLHSTTEKSVLCWQKQT